MDIIGTIPTYDTPVAQTVRRYRPDGSFCEERCDVQRENLLDVYVNGLLTMRLTCSLGHLPELVIGRLYTEGVVRGLDEIDCLSFCEQAMRADVELPGRAADLAREFTETTPSCCTGNRTLNGYFRIADEPDAVVPIPWDPAQVFSLAREFACDSDAHRKTRGTHSCRIAMGDRVLLCREDVGRHNALDKAVGSAMLEGIDLRDCIAFTSGRVPTDMAAKAMRAGIPVLASKAVATDKALELARTYRLTLVCRATEDSFDALNDPLRDEVEARRRAA